MKTKQNGFAVLESLLILVIIAIIGGTGYYVWRSKNQTNKTLDNASSASQSSTTGSQSQKKATPQPSATKLSLDGGNVSFNNPNAWSSTQSTGKCAISVDSKASCLDSLFVSPTDATKASAGDAFGVSVTVATYSNAVNLSDWYWNVYQGGEIQSDEDTVSGSSINGYDAYTRTQTDKSFTDKYYVLHKGSVAVVVFARLIDTDFTSSGSIAEQSDNTQYQPQLTNLVNSIAIK